MNETEIKVHLVCTAEEEDVRGNVSAIDSETDKAAEDQIFKQLESGNQWAWCSVEVYAVYRGLRGDSDYLGCCSYPSEASFREPGGYFDDMKAQAIENLWSKWKELHR